MHAAALAMDRSSLFVDDEDALLQQQAAFLQAKEQPSARVIRIGGNKVAQGAGVHSGGSWRGTAPVQGSWRSTARAEPHAACLG